MNPMEQLQGTAFYRYFKEISAVPRGSGDEKRISDYLVRFAADHNLDCIQDEQYNVIIRKPASAGKGGSPPLVLQSHMDMVCEKLEDSGHNFAKDPITIVERDGYLRANGTTLGADNAVGMSFTLAVLADNAMIHPEIEAVFTTGEEVGMEGMAALDADSLRGKRMINLDAEDEGSFFTSCAGGERLFLELPATFAPVTGGALAHTISVEGLEGGHSGLDIGRGRANANLLLARVLLQLGERYAIQLQDIQGGQKTNSIPRQASATVWLAKDEVSLVKRELDRIEKDLRREYADKDPGISLTLAAAAPGKPAAMDGASQQKVLAAILLMPCGVLSYSPHLEGMVDSSCNLGIVETLEDKILLSGLARANINSKLDDVVARLKLLAGALGGIGYTRNRYAAWEFRAESELRPLCMRVYEEVHGATPEIAAIHAGLECALMADKRPDMDMIAIGPNMFDAHTPSERVEIASLLRMWAFVQKLLEEA